MHGQPHIRFSEYPSSVHSLRKLTTGPWSRPQWVFHRVWASASPFNLQYPLVSFRSSNSCLRLQFRIPINFILPSIFPSITCFRSHFLRKTWTIQLAFLLFTVRRIFPQQKLNPMWVFTKTKRVDELEDWSKTHVCLSFSRVVLVLCYFHINQMKKW